MALLIRWPKHWCSSISPSNEYSELIFFRIGWFDILAVQGTLKHLLQHHNSKTSILWHSAFFMVELSHLYMTTGKTIALTIQTFVSKVMSLLFNILSRFVITCLSRSKCVKFMAVKFISPSTVILEPKKSRMAHHKILSKLKGEEIRNIYLSWIISEWSQIDLLRKAIDNFIPKKTTHSL